MIKTKEYFIEQVASQMDLSEDLVSKIVNFQGEDALKAVKKHAEVEFSGFGIFYLSQTKLKKRINKINRILEHLDKKEKTELLLNKISSIRKELDELNLRLCQNG